jgi:hypothetical protein
VFGHALPEGETKTAPKGEANMLPKGETKAASEGVTKAESVELDGSTAAFEPCICPSENVGVATSRCPDDRLHAVTSKGTTRCKLVRRK